MSDYAKKHAKWTSPFYRTCFSSNKLACDCLNCLWHFHQQRGENCETANASPLRVYRAHSKTTLRKPLSGECSSWTSEFLPGCCSMHHPEIPGGFPFLTSTGCITSCLKPCVWLCKQTNKWRDGEMLNMDQCYALYNCAVSITRFRTYILQLVTNFVELYKM